MSYFYINITRSGLLATLYSSPKAYWMVLWRWSVCQKWSNCRHSSIKYWTESHFPQVSQLGGWLPRNKCMWLKKQWPIRSWTLKTSSWQDERIDDDQALIVFLMWCSLLVLVSHSSCHCKKKKKHDHKICSLGNPTKYLQYMMQWTFALVRRYFMWCSQLRLQSYVRRRNL